MSSTMGIREAKERVEAALGYHGNTFPVKLAMIKLVREVYWEGVRIGQANANINSDEPTQLDRIEAMLIAFIKEER